jgi:DNA-binding transcriptional MerR regulator
MGVNNLAKTSDERRAAIRGLLARGMTIKSITEQLKCSTHTVTAVREMDAEPIADEQAILAKKWTNVAQLGVEQIQERLAEGEQVGMKELSIVAAVASDKLLALKGEPTARIIHERADSAAELKEMLKAALEEKQAAVDVGPAEGPAELKEDKEPVIDGITAAQRAEAEPQPPSGPESILAANEGRGGSAKPHPPPNQNDSPLQKISPNVDR